MVRRLAAAGLILILTASASASFAQQPGAPVPLYPGPLPRSIEPEPLPPVAPTPSGPAVAPSAAPAVEPPVAGLSPGAYSAPPGARIFCEQPVTVQLIEPDAVPQRFRAFLGMWSDAAWTPQLCAALVVENIARDGTATIVYAFGPMGPNLRGPGGVLHGTGIIRDGELRFQNSDGTQFAFRPLYSDLDGRLTTAQGQTYQAIFKKAL